MLLPERTGRHLTAPPLPHFEDEHKERCSQLLKPTQPGVYQEEKKKKKAQISIRKAIRGKANWFFDKETATKAAFTISPASFIHCELHVSFYSLGSR